MKLSSYSNTVIVSLGTIALIYILKPVLIPLVLGAFFWFLFDVIWKKAWWKNASSKFSKGLWIFFLVLSFVLIIVALSGVWMYFENNFTQFMSSLQSSALELKEYLLATSQISESMINTLLERSTDGVSFTNFNGFIWTTFWFLLNTILVFVYAILFIIYREKIALLLELLIPGEWQEHLTVIHNTVFNYSKWLLVLVTVVAVLYAFWLRVVWVPYALLIAWGSALLTLVPVVGTFVWWMGAIIATWLLSGSLMKAWVIAIWYVCIQLWEEYIILPKVVWKRVELNIFATIFSIVVWGLIRWVAWIFLAIPIMGVFTKILENKKSRYVDLLE